MLHLCTRSAPTLVTSKANFYLPMDLLVRMGKNLPFPGLSPPHQDLPRARACLSEEDPGLHLQTDPPWWEPRVAGLQVRVGRKIRFSGAGGGQLTSQGRLLKAAISAVRLSFFGMKQSLSDCELSLMRLSERAQSQRIFQEVSQRRRRDALAYDQYKLGS